MCLVDHVSYSESGVSCRVHYPVVFGVAHTDRAETVRINNDDAVRTGVRNGVGQAPAIQDIRNLVSAISPAERAGDMAVDLVVCCPRQRLVGDVTADVIVKYLVGGTHRR